MTVKRYGDTLIGIKEMDDGKWVSHEDYAALLKDRDALAVENAVLKKFRNSARTQPSMLITKLPDDKQLRALFDAWFSSDCSFDRSPDATEEDNIAWRESYWYVWKRCLAAMLKSVTNEP